MRILLPSRILDRHVGGNTTYARRIAQGLAERGIEVGRIPSGRNPVFTAALETREALMGHPACTVLHYTSDTGPLLKARTPSVVTIHGVATRWVPGVRSHLADVAWRARVGRAARSCAHVITGSASGSRDVQAVFGVPESKITVIPHGIDVAHFSAPQTVSESVGQRLPRRFALYVGNIEPRKNLVPLIRAFESPGVRELGLGLVIAGRFAWDYEATARAIEESSNTTYLGFVSDEDRVALMQRSDVFVFPSLYEGFGFPVLEAMAAGAPVITSNRGSLAEVAGPARRIEVLGSAGIADAVTAAMNDESWLRTHRSDGAQWVAQFDWGRSVEEHVRVYRQVLQQ